MCRRLQQDRGCISKASLCRQMETMNPSWVRQGGYLSVMAEADTAEEPQRGHENPKRVDHAGHGGFGWINDDRAAEAQAEALSSDKSLDAI